MILFGFNGFATVLFKIIDRSVKDAILGRRKLKKFQLLMQLWIRYE
ncbi:BnaC04g24000D [Brassica napus]|uniref:BnaC04g24000D protein n=1 Tax=Brassica napus TaxID=3708 RepID=A0A078IET0_BRANA|nr:BnaC04g24000D [Brassica napus]